MGKIIRIAVAVVFIYAVWQAGSAYWQYLELQDRVERIAQLGVERDRDEVRAAVVNAAAELGVTLDPERIDVRFGDNSLEVDTTYERPITILPGATVPWTFNVKAHAWLIPSGGIRNKGAGVLDLAPPSMANL